MNRARVSAVAVSYRRMTDSWQVWDSQNDCAADERAKRLCIREPPELQKAALTMKTTQFVWFRTAFPAVADTVSCHLWCVCAELTGSPAHILPPWSLCTLSMKLFIPYFFTLTAYLRIHFRCKCPNLNVFHTRDGPYWTSGFIANSTRWKNSRWITKSVSPELLRKIWRLQISRFITSCWRHTSQRKNKHKV